MRENFDRAFLLVIGAEGKPTNAPDDPGGFTAFDFAVTSAPADAVALLKVTRHWEEFMIRRIKHYSEVVRKKPKMAKYFRGWVNRVINLWLEIQPH